MKRQEKTEEFRRFMVVARKEINATYKDKPQSVRKPMIMKRAIELYEAGKR
jgi:hypothetical protein